MRPNRFRGRRNGRPAVRQPRAAQPAHVEDASDAHSGRASSNDTLFLSRPPSLHPSTRPNDIHNRVLVITNFRGHFGCINTRGGGVMRARHYDTWILKSRHSGRAFHISQISTLRFLDQILCLLQLTPSRIDLSICWLLAFQ